jgi:hypothetical protein
LLDCRFQTIDEEMVPGIVLVEDGTLSSTSIGIINGEGSNSTNSLQV